MVFGIAFRGGVVLPSGYSPSSPPKNIIFGTEKYILLYCYSGTDSKCKKVEMGKKGVIAKKGAIPKKKNTKKWRDSKK
jgi:hypothetical protein